MRKLMEQAQQMQAQLAATQEVLAAKTYEGTAGGSAVMVVVNGATPFCQLSVVSHQLSVVSGQLHPVGPAFQPVRGQA